MNTKKEVMGWRRTVHRLTGKCMARTAVLSKAEVRVEFSTECDGETLASAGLFKFGDLVDAANGTPDEIASAISEWLENHCP